MLRVGRGEQCVQKQTGASDKNTPVRPSNSRQLQPQLQPTFRNDIATWQQTDMFKISCNNMGGWCIHLGYGVLHGKDETREGVSKQLGQLSTGQSQELGSRPFNLHVCFGTVMVKSSIQQV